MKKILFVCLGNICRSPAAEGVFRKMFAAQNPTASPSCDSCGTGNWHIGSLPDARMRRAGARRGYNFTHRARQLRESDFTDFDIIIAMDRDNRTDILVRAPSEFDDKKVRLFTEFCTGKFANFRDVPDPYYGGEKDFELALDIIENGCAALVNLAG